MIASFVYLTIADIYILDNGSFIHAGQDRIKVKNPMKSAENLLGLVQLPSSEQQQCC
jgi:hypothetical protein